MENGYVIIGRGEITINYAQIKSQSNLKDIFRLLDGLSKARVRSYFSEAVPCWKNALSRGSISFTQSTARTTSS
jgi:hypothetical protein